MASGGAIVGFLLALALGLGTFTVLSPSEDNSTSVTAESPKETVVATEFSFTPPIIESNGEIALALKNDGAIYHDLKIEGLDNFHLTALPGETDSASVTLEVGRYTLYCSVPGHRDSGMTAQLVVN
ncbi:MAG: hypothetical protein HOC65_07125 [Actinobacteria bacterium]|jgi:plastocyanin|nr:hypothetical protein [Actinomycetota bacterium]MBT6970764.1 hypothetical protein [Actinomycetota bacterium]